MTGTVLPRAKASSIIGRRNRTDLLLPRGLLHRSQGWVSSASRS
ncbi:hypothetical protein ACF1GX_30985 [Streptomyces albidoflavus]